MSEKIGIDYSLSCPCICFISDEKIEFRFLSDTKKYDGVWKTKFGTKSVIIKGYEHKDWKHPLGRYNNIAQGILGKTDDDITRLTKAKSLNIEDYSMGSKGKVFHIAENVAVLKNYIWLLDIKYVTTPPTVLKKFATGKGNSDKEAMYASWLAETNIDLKDLMDCTSAKVPSPISDIVDSYYLAKMG